MKRNTIRALLLCCSVSMAHAQWGDQGNGT